jgi:hypothetical protein
MLCNVVLGKPTMACEQMAMAMPSTASMQHNQIAQVHTQTVMNMTTSKAEHAEHMHATELSATDLSATELSATDRQDDKNSNTSASQHTVANQDHNSAMQMDCCDNDCHCPVSACLSISALLNNYPNIQLTPATEMAMPYHFTSLTHINSHPSKPPIITVI